MSRARGEAMTEKMETNLEVLVVLHESLAYTPEFDPFEGEWAALCALCTTLSHITRQ
jgi:hypothetical protein